MCELFTIDIRKRAADGQTCYFFFLNRLCSFLVLCTTESYLFFLTVPSCFYSHLASIS